MIIMMIDNKETSFILNGSSNFTFLLQKKCYGFHIRRYNLHAEPNHLHRMYRIYGSFQAQLPIYGHVLDALSAM